MNTIPSLSLAMVCVARAMCTDVHGAEPADLPPHPRLLLDARGVAALRDKIHQPPWADLWRQRLRALERAIAEPLRLPPRGGNWYHNYVCPEHGVRLTEGPRIGDWTWEHRCRIGPHMLRGDPAVAARDFDGYSIMAIHNALAAEARDAGLAWAVTGDERYAERAAAIVRAYAAAYTTYARHDNQGRPVRSRGAGGRVGSQPLSEATWLVPLLQGADFVWSRLSEPDRHRFESNLVRVAIEETIRNPDSNPCVHNIQCHRNAAIGLAGFLLGDTNLVHEAIHGRHGWHTNLANGVMADGTWFEGAWGYHTYTLSALWPLAEAARHAGIDLYGPPLRRMYEAPMMLATPDGRLPAFNDSTETSLAAMSDLYELAFVRYGDPVFTSPIRESGRRTGSLALWYGAPSLPDAALARAPSRSRNLPAAGYAILQRGDGPEATWLCLKYGPHGGGHGHFDKNHFVLRTRRVWRLGDVGTHLYGSDLHRDWDKTSIAHNTLTVDEASQAAAAGRCLAFGSAEGVDYVMAEAGPIYPHLRFVRTVALLETNVVLVCDRVTSDRPRQLDVAVHLGGVWTHLPAGRPWLPPPAPGYRRLRDAIILPPSNRVTLAVRVPDDDSPTQLVAASPDPLSVICAHGVGASSADQVPVAILRRTATDWFLVWSLIWNDSAAPVGLDPTLGDDGRERVRIVQGRRVLDLILDTARGRVAITVPP